MLDITDWMNEYRECSRNLWNVYFGPRENTSDLEDNYEQIRRLLFEGLVVGKLKEQENPTTRDVQVFALCVTPSNSAPILIRRPSKDGNWYWDQGRGMTVSAEDIQLEFTDYYDYARYPIKDFRFYLCRILTFSAHAEYEGKEALVEVGHARVGFEQEQARER
jgi:hypothetical protein